MGRWPAVQPATPASSHTENHDPGIPRIATMRARRRGSSATPRERDPMDRMRTWFALRPAVVGTAITLLALIVAACNNSGGSSGY